MSQSQRKSKKAVAIPEFGDIVAFPLTGGGWGVAVVARRAQKVVRSSRMVYLYGLKWTSPSPPTAEDIPLFASTPPIAQGITGDWEVREGTWLLLGRFPEFKQECWPLPKFLVRRSRELHGSEFDHCQTIEFVNDDLGKFLAWEDLDPREADHCNLPQKIAYSTLNFVYYMERRLGLSPPRPPVDYYDGTQYDDLVLPSLGQHPGANHSKT